MGKYAGVSAYDEITTRSTTVVMVALVIVCFFLAFVDCFLPSDRSGDKSQREDCSEATIRSDVFGASPTAAQRRFMTGLSEPNAFIDMVNLLWVESVAPLF